ncbi:MAG TPA: hypothetical protein LFW21_03885 [Rickettsia endosymbiont of Pyrocoelia pectoralis]|nr:hypothetical protein [Rickettsia endosymbiont of Pyrocoelia pectoralis]
MKRKDDITSFSGTIIAYSANNTYADRKNILDNGLNSRLIYASVGSAVTKWDDEDGLSIQTFKKASSIKKAGSISTKCLDSDLPLTLSSFEQKAYPDIRFATAKEVTKLKELVANNKIELGYTQKEEAIKTLTDYLDNKEAEESTLLGITTES